MIKQCQLAMAAILVFLGLMVSTGFAEESTPGMADEQLLKNLQMYVEKSQGLNWFQRGRMLERNSINMELFSEGLLGNNAYMDYWSDALRMYLYRFRGDPRKVIDKMMQFLERDEPIYTTPIREAKIHALLIIDLFLDDPKAREQEEVKAILLNRVAPFIVDNGLTDYKVWMKRLNVKPTGSLEREKRPGMTTEEQERAKEEYKPVQQAQSAAKIALSIVGNLYLLTDSMQFRAVVEAATASESRTVRRRAETLLRDDYRQAWEGGGLQYLLPWAEDIGLPVRGDIKGATDSSSSDIAQRRRDAAARGDARRDIEQRKADAE